MIGTALGVVLDGIDIVPVRVEADVRRGLPAFSIVGLPDSAVTESKLRIRAAIQNANLPFPRERITVNLSPASLRKHGAGLDLAIAIAILRAQGLIPAAENTDMAFCAELNLSGTLCAVDGLSRLSWGLATQGTKSLLIPACCQDEILPLATMKIFTATSLEDVVHHLPARDFKLARAGNVGSTPYDAGFDLNEVRGLQGTKRGLTIAAIGHHHAMLIGPPGSGKTMLAERLHTLLPDLSEHHAVEIHGIHQAMGQSTIPSIRPPMRTPHHSITQSGLIGGGNPLTPGEVTLAHHGVLVLDELLEFQPRTLQSLREPLVTGTVHLSRSGRRSAFPANFQLIATLNPCPCGYFGYGDCRCGEYVVQKYWRKISGPLLDRVDLSLSITPGRPVMKDVRPAEYMESSAAVRNVVARAQAQLAERLHGLQRHRLKQNADFDDNAKSLTNQMSEALGLSSRGVDSMVRVARSISVLDGKDAILPEHVQEAASIRTTAARQHQ